MSNRIQSSQRLFVLVFICALSMRAGEAFADPDSPFLHIWKAERLYACSDFDRMLSDAANDEHQKESLKKGYLLSLALAQAEATAAYPNENGELLANKLAIMGHQDFERFRASLDSVPAGEEFNKKMGEYANACLKLLQ